MQFSRNFRILIYMKRKNKDLKSVVFLERILYDVHISLKFPCSLLDGLGFNHKGYITNTSPYDLCSQNSLTFFKGIQGDMTSSRCIHCTSISLCNCKPIKQITSSCLPAKFIANAAVNGRKNFKFCTRMDSETIT